MRYLAGAFSLLSVTFIAQAQQPGAGGSKPAHAENWSSVEGVFFQSATGFGIGGMVTVDYEPLIFFRDGTYVEMGEPALEDMDLAASKQSKPKLWGHWR